MANTNFFKTEVEPYVRKQLEEDHKRTFRRMAKHMTLTTSGKHEFDAVSVDGNIVASIKSHSGKAKNGRRAAGSYLACVAELYYLSLVEAEKRILVLTDPDMYKLLKDNIEGKNRLAPGISIKLIELSKDLQAKMKKFRPTAQSEVSPLVPSDDEPDNL